MAQTAAIFWPPFYDMEANFSSVARSEARVLGRNEFHDRAPLHGIRGDNTITWAPTQATMDAEITAASGKIDCWIHMYQWPFVRQTNDAWRLHQSSSIKNSMKWCWMYDLRCLGSTGNYTTEITDLVAKMGDSAYFKTLGGTRPLFVLYWTEDHLASLWGNDPLNVKAALQALKAAAVTAGVGEPYVMLMAFNPSVAAAAKVAVGNSAGGVDAIANYYNYAPTSIRPVYADVKALGPPIWDWLKLTGHKMAPTVMMGWNTTPRIVSSMWSTSVPYLGEAKQAILPTTGEITAAIAEAKAYLATYASACETQLIIIYAYSEYSEGGILGLTHGDPTGQRLAAVLAGMA